jgi:hypothetical protein
MTGENGKTGKDAAESHSWELVSSKPDFSVFYPHWGKLRLAFAKTRSPMLDASGQKISSGCPRMGLAGEWQKRKNSRRALSETPYQWPPAAVWPGHSRRTLPPED